MVRRAATIALAVMACISVIASPAQSADEFYKGKTVRIVSGYSPGGTYDLYARTLAPFISKYLPGQPNVIVQSMTGAGSLKAANFIYSLAPKDGTVFGTFSRGAPLLALTSKGTAAQFDARKFNWIGTTSSGATDVYMLLIRSENRIKNIEQLRMKGDYAPVLAGTALGSASTDIPLVLREVLNLNMKIVIGYPGQNDIELAIERKEADLEMTSLRPVTLRRPAWVENWKVLRPLLQFARETRHSALPDIPLASELVSNDDDKNLIRMLEMPFFMAYPYAAPPGVPAERVALLREAFMKAINDKDYRADAEKRGIELSPVRGEEIQALVERLNELPKALIDRYEKILRDSELDERSGGTKSKK